MEILRNHGGHLNGQHDPDHRYGQFGALLVGFERIHLFWFVANITNYLTIVETVEILQVCVSDGSGNPFTRGTGEKDYFTKVNICQRNSENFVCSGQRDGA